MNALVWERYFTPKENLWNFGRDMHKFPVHNITFHLHTIRVQHRYDGIRQHDYVSNEIDHALTMRTRPDGICDSTQIVPTGLAAESMQNIHATQARDAHGGLLMPMPPTHADEVGDDGRDRVEHISAYWKKLVSGIILTVLELQSIRGSVTEHVGDDETDFMLTCISFC